MPPPTGEWMPAGPQGISSTPGVLGVWGVASSDLAVRAATCCQLCLGEVERGISIEY